MLNYMIYLMFINVTNVVSPVGKTETIFLNPIVCPVFKSPDKRITFGSKLSLESRTWMDPEPARGE